jgi:hypothetical protein
MGGDPGMPHPIRLTHRLLAVSRDMTCTSEQNISLTLKTPPHK